MNKKLIAVIVAVIISIGGAALYYFLTNNEEIPTRGTFVREKKQNDYIISIGDNNGYYLYKTA